MTDRPRGGKDELSRTLLDLRRAAGLSTREASQRAGFSQAKVSRLERGINIPSEADVTALADAYRAAPDVRQRLAELANDIRAEHRPVVMARGRGRPGVFQARLARIEASSAHVRAFSPIAVPGLLQTETYMRELIAPRELPPDRVEDFVQQRLRRQELLNRPERRFTIIMTAGALGWRFGSPEDMAVQTERIAAAADLPAAKVGIIPWGTRARRLVLHSWDIYDERAVSYGTTDATAILTEPPDVARYLELAAMVEEMAVYGEHAREVLIRIADEYRTLGRPQSPNA